MIEALVSEATHPIHWMALWYIKSLEARMTAFVGTTIHLTQEASTMGV